MIIVCEDVFEGLEFVLELVVVLVEFIMVLVLKLGEVFELDEVFDPVELIILVELVALELVLLVATATEFDVEFDVEFEAEFNVEFDVEFFGMFEVELVVVELFCPVVVVLLDEFEMLAVLEVDNIYLGSLICLSTTGEVVLFIFDVLFMDDTVDFVSFPYLRSETIISTIFTSYVTLFKFPLTINSFLLLLAQTTVFSTQK